MQTITLEIRQPETMSWLEETSRRRGKQPADFIADLLEVERLASQSFDEIAAPVRADFVASGMTEEEFDDLIEQARQANWEEKQTRT